MHIFKQPRVHIRGFLFLKNKQLAKGEDEMKVILSRKGFDSGTGGYPSPILPDGTLLSLPIPDATSDIKYSDLKHKENSYYELMKSLKGTYLKDNGNKSSLSKNTSCHLDPDLVYDVFAREKGWRGIFGQIDRAQSHLENQEVKEGDLFLFFGWFRRTIVIGGKLKFDPSDKFGRHIIYGYLQVEEVIQADDQRKLKSWMEYHPHALESRLCRNKNTLYIAKEELSFMKGLPGYGTFKYENHRAITKEGEQNRSYWDLPSEFRKLEISCHKKSDWTDEFFKSNARGQEFVFQEDDAVLKWAREVLTDEKTLTREIEENDKQVIENMFNPTPKQWGLRGDPYLWESLRKHFEQEGLPNKIDEFEIELIKLFKSKTNKSIFDKQSVFVGEYAYGGMSSGQIYIDKWRDEFIPLLMSRFIDRKKRKGGGKL